MYSRIDTWQASTKAIVSKFYFFPANGEAEHSRYGNGDIECLAGNLMVIKKDKQKSFERNPGCTDFGLMDDKMSIKLKSVH